MYIYTYIYIDIFINNDESLVLTINVTNCTMLTRNFVTKVRTKMYLLQF